MPFAGRLAGVEAYTARKQAASIELRHQASLRQPTPLWTRKAASGQPPTRGWPGVAGVEGRGMLPKGLPVNLGELPVSAVMWASVTGPTQQDQVSGDEGSPRGKRTNPRRAETYCQGRPEAAATGRRAVLRTHGTCEGGEPQGSRKGRPRYPLEGRGEQVDVSAQRHIAETQNSEIYVKWN